ncbi:hypothetical protein BH10PSE3_BH10PSE3_04530 [soil metagenome]
MSGAQLRTERVPLMKITSFWSPPSSDWRLPAELVELIYAEIFQPITAEHRGKFFHNILQRRIQALGTSLSYEARIEVPTPYLDQNRSGRVDVVWNAPPGGRSIAFEIDSWWRKKSLKKLIHMSATHQPVSIYYGKAMVPTPAPDSELRKIHVVRADPNRIGEFAKTGRC